MIHLNASITIFDRTRTAITCLQGITFNWKDYSINEKKKDVHVTTDMEGPEGCVKVSRWEQHFHTKERRKLECGAGGQGRGRKRGDRRGKRSFRVATKTTEALQEFGNQWTLFYPPLLLYSSPSPSMWGKPPGVTAMRFPWALTCGPLTLLRNVLCCCCSALRGIFVRNEIIFCRGQEQ